MVGMDLAARKPPSPAELDAICRTFPTKTALGMDALHPRSVILLPEGAKRALGCLFVALLAYGSPPECIGLLMVALIPN
eukprot:4497356-Prorocentrum_lima.AAC.1